MKPEKSGKIPLWPEETPETEGRSALKSLGAVLGLLLAGPTLALTLAVIVPMLIVCGCIALGMFAIPFHYDELMAIGRTAESQRQATATTQTQVEISLATVTALPLPAQVETFIPFTDLTQWDFSADGEYAALVGPERLAIVQLTTRQMRFVELEKTLKDRLQYGGAVWLGARQLLVYQIRYDGLPRGYRLIEVQDRAGFKLRESAVQEIRGYQVTPNLLEDKKIFRFEDVSHGLVAAVIDKATATVIIAYGADEREGFATLLAGRVVKQVSPDMTWQALDPYASNYMSDSYATWRTLEQYHAPDGQYYAAVWPDQAGLAILRSGEIMFETQASDFGHTLATCRLIPLGWLPNSKGVLFLSRCRDPRHRTLFSTKGPLLLPIPNP